MLNFQDQVRLHEPLVDPDGYFSENQNKIILQNVVISVTLLRGNEDQADQIFTHTGTLYIMINMPH